MATHAEQPGDGFRVHLLWIIFIGLVVRLIAARSRRAATPLRVNLITLLGIAGEFPMTFVGQTISWYRTDQGAGLIAAAVGAVGGAFVRQRLVEKRVIPDPDNPSSPSFRRLP